MKFDKEVYHLTNNTINRINTFVEHEMLGVLEAKTAMDNIRTEITMHSRKMRALMDRAVKEREGE